MQKTQKKINFVDGNKIILKISRVLQEIHANFTLKYVFKGV